MIFSFLFSRSFLVRKEPKELYEMGLIIVFVCAQTWQLI